VRLADGRWLLLHAAHLDGSPDEPGRIAVILDPAPRAEVVPLLLRLRGLSVRELEVSQLLLTGLPTDEVASRLHISRHTLRDHVKAIFTKVGANSRSEMMALLAAA
jgi:DNA-binding CsgD family transcriptional regulator